MTTLAELELEERLNLVSAVFRFSQAMLEKLLVKDHEGWTGWDEPENREDIRANLGEHAQKLAAGDTTQAVDVANLAMFLYFMDHQDASEEGIEG